MKRKILLQALETYQKRVADVKTISEQDPYLDAYIIHLKIFRELIDLLRTTPEKFMDIELIRWIQRQETAGLDAANKVKLRNEIKTLDAILQIENTKVKNNLS